MAPLDEGVPTQGMVTLDTKRKTVQHLSGGIVKEVLVQEGQQVKEGQVLLRLDGAVAKAWGQASKRGAFFDSVSDRVTDALLFGGVTWYLVASDGRPWVVMLPVACYATASWVSYVRAKADSLGFDARGGLVERAERFILLALGLLFPSLLLPVLALIVVLNAITAGQRFVKVWRQATADTPALSDRRRRRPRVGRSTSQRWAERRTSRPTSARRRPGGSA